MRRHLHSLHPCVRLHPHLLQLCLQLCLSRLHPLLQLGPALRLRSTSESPRWGASWASTGHMTGGQMYLLLKALPQSIRVILDLLIAAMQLCHLLL
jgi:hypothetical protein